MSNIKSSKQRGKLEGTVKVPPSKSVTHRALFVAALSQKPATIVNPSFCEDNIATMRALTDLGAEFVVEGPMAQKMVEQGFARAVDDTGASSENQVIVTRSVDMARKAQEDV